MTDLTSSAERLIRNLEEQQPLLRTLLDEMRRERASFIAARPSILERVQEKLLPTAEHLAQLEATRREISDSIQSYLQMAGDLSVTRLTPHLPDTLAEELQEVAKITTGLANALRIEQAVGSRLLSFSHQAQEGMYRDLMGLQDGTPPGYDRGAKTLTNSPGSGQLISGLV